MGQKGEVISRTVFCPRFHNHPSQSTPLKDWGDAAASGCTNEHHCAQDRGGPGHGGTTDSACWSCGIKVPPPVFRGEVCWVVLSSACKTGTKTQSGYPYRLDFSCTALKVAPRVSSVSFCQFIPSPPALSPTHSWYSSCRIVDSLAVANKSSSCLFCSALALTAFAM